MRFIGLVEMESKPFRVLTGWLIGSQVLEMNAFDDLHGESSRCSVVHQADEDLWCGALADGLEGRGAFAACHIGQTALGFTTLQAFQMQTENCSLANDEMIFVILFVLHI